MFGRNKKPSSSTRLRQNHQRTTDTFRRNNVVISRRQWELAEHQRSVSQRQLDKKRAYQRRTVRLKIICGVVVVLLGVLFWMMSVHDFRVSATDMSQIPASKQQLYSTSILQEFQAHSLFGQPWLLDESAFRTAITVKHPEIASLQVEKSLISRTAEAKTTFRRPILTWLDASKNLQYIDEHGVLFDQTLLDASAVAQLIKIEDQAPQPQQAGVSVAGGQLIQFTGQLPKKLSPLYGGKPVERIIIPPSARELHVQMKESSYLIKLSSARSLDAQAGELAVLLAFLKSHDITPKEYIDIRIPAKTFYK